MLLALSTLLMVLTPPLSTEDILNRLADSTCSNPRRAGIRARAETRVPPGGEAALTRDVEAFIARAGLRGGGAESWSGSNEPYYHTNDFILHSPHNTVVLEIIFDTRSDTIELRVERNCFDDSPLEDWRPYWSQLIRHLRARNYIVRPISRSRRN
jgi:hypothetical protein